MRAEITMMNQTVTTSLIKIVSANADNKSPCYLMRNCCTAYMYVCPKNIIDLLKQLSINYYHGTQHGKGKQYSLILLALILCVRSIISRSAVNKRTCL